MNLFRSIKRHLIDFIKSEKLLRFYIDTENRGEKKSKTIISMIDGRLKHGGLSDRLSGIVSAYQYCCTHGCEFKLHFVYPYELSLFLEPNAYDWRISPKDISYERNVAAPLYISLYSHDVKKMRVYADAKLNRKCNQIHLYSNMYYFYEDEFSFFFHKLFKKTALLENALNENLSSLGRNYASVTFRFQQLLGDFRETGFPSLNSEDDKKVLISTINDFIQNINSDSFEYYVNLIMIGMYVMMYLEKV